MTGRQLEQHRQAKSRLVSARGGIRTVGTAALVIVTKDVVGLVARQRRRGDAHPATPKARQTPAVCYRTRCHAVQRLRTCRVFNNYIVFCLMVRWDYKHRLYWIGMCLFCRKFAIRAQSEKTMFFYFYVFFVYRARNIDKCTHCRGEVRRCPSRCRCSSRSSSCAESDWGCYPSWAAMNLHIETRSLHQIRETLVIHCLTKVHGEKFICKLYFFYKKIHYFHIETLWHTRHVRFLLF